VTKYTVGGLAIFGVIVLGLFLRSRVVAAESVAKNGASLYSIPIRSLSGEPMELSRYRHHVILVVNVASRCGFTDQYKDLEALYQRFHTDGLVIIGVPSNDFLGQEPGTSKEIQAFCQTTYGVTFPMTEKVSVTGSKQHDLFRFLTQSNPKYSGRVMWNFSKFLVDRNGQVVDRFAPTTRPSSPEVVSRISAVLTQK